MVVVTAEQLLILQTIYSEFRRDCVWPALFTVGRTLVREVDLEQEMKTLPAGLLYASDAWQAYYDVGGNNRSEAPISVRALRLCPNATEDLSAFLLFLRLCVDKFYDPNQDPGVTPQDVERLPGIGEDVLRRAYQIAHAEGGILGNGSVGIAGRGWERRISPDIRSFREVTTLRNYLDVRSSLRREQEVISEDEWEILRFLYRPFEDERLQRSVQLMKTDQQAWLQYLLRRGMQGPAPDPLVCEPDDVIELVNLGHIIRGDTPNHFRLSEKGLVSAQAELRSENKSGEPNSAPPTATTIVPVPIPTFGELQNTQSAQRARGHATSSLENRMGITKNPDGRVTIFIGHGGNPQWKDLELYLRRLDRFNVINFESGPRAGFATKEVLKRMLDEADIAFLIHTAEDEVGDQVRARENVVHEAGLFQGRLGFERAIIVLEQGCHEYSNIVGVSQIRFPKGQIKMAFSEIRDVIDREFSQ